MLSCSAKRSEIGGQAVKEEDILSTDMSITDGNRILEDRRPNTAWNGKEIAHLVSWTCLDSGCSDRWVYRSNFQVVSASWYEAMHQHQYRHRSSLYPASTYSFLHSFIHLRYHRRRRRSTTHLSIPSTKHLNLRAIQSCLSSPINPLRLSQSFQYVVSVQCPHPLPSPLAA